MTWHLRRNRHSRLESLESRVLLASDLDVAITSNHDSMPLGDQLTYEVAITNTDDVSVVAQVDVRLKPFGRELNVDDLDGTNGFRVTTRRPDSDGPWPDVKVLGDVNGDSFVDFHVANSVIFGGSVDVQDGVADLRELDGTNGFYLDTDGLPGEERRLLSLEMDAGDFNGDGFSDILFGLGGSQQPMVFVLFGSEGIGASGSVDLSGLPRFIGEPAGEPAWKPSVADAGDFNGDGFNDILIGIGGAAPRGQEFAGEAHLIFGGENLSEQFETELSQLDGSNGFTLQGTRGGGTGLNNNSRGDFAGDSVSAADVNGDGYSDLLIGASGAIHNGRSTMGKVYVMFGGQDPNQGEAILRLSSMRDGHGFIIAGNTPWGYFGEKLSVGDLNADGYEDVVVANRHDSIYVILGAASIDHVDLTEPNDRVIRLECCTQIGFGNRLKVVGDFNNDGVVDLLAGEYYYDENAFLLFGGAEFALNDGLSLAAGINGENGIRLYSHEYFWFGVAAAGPSDFNGDGIDDFIVEAWHDDVAKDSFVVFGADHEPKLSATRRLTIEPGETVEYQFFSPVAESSPGERVVIATEKVEMQPGRRARGRRQSL